MWSYSLCQSKKEYGYNPNLPIKVGSGINGGAENQRKYLDLLRDNNGNKISYQRLASCCPYPSSNGLFGQAMCDKYRITYQDKNGSEIDTILYLSFYDYDTPSAPNNLFIKESNIDCILEPSINCPDVDPNEVNEIKLLFDDLKTIPDFIFAYKNLESLDLSYNQIKKIPNKISELTKLKILKIPGNYSIKLPKKIVELKNLEEIYLSPGMDWDDTFEKLSKLPNLKRINLWEADIHELPPVLANFGNLEELNLKNNPNLDLKNVFTLLAKLPKLKTLSLGISLWIEEIPSNIVLLKNIEYLEITSTAITTLPEKFGEMKNIKELNLFGNRYLETLPISIGNLWTLEIINLEYMDVPFNYPVNFKRLSKCPTLKKLILNQNHKVERFPPEIGEMLSLEYLDLSSCSNLKEFPKEIGKLTNLKYLDIGASSNISSIPLEFSQLINLETINIGGQVGYSFENEFKKLGNLPKLEEIIVEWGEQEIPNIIVECESLKILQMKNYWSQFVTDEQILRLKGLVPNCLIITE